MLKKTKNIKLNISNSNLIDNDVSELDKLYFSVENFNIENMNEINLYSEINYNIYFPTIVQNGEKYYFTIALDNQLIETTNMYNTYTYNYLYGIIDNKFAWDQDSLESYIIFNKFFKINEVNQNYTWYIYKLSRTNTGVNIYDKYEYIKGGKIKINNPLVYLKLNYKQNELIVHDIQDEYYNTYKDFIRIENNSLLNEIKENIILYKNINYIFSVKEINSAINKFINIYNNNIEDYDIITETKNNYTILNTNKLNKKINKYKWKLDNDNGDIILIDEIKNVSNDEILYDLKLRNINILNRLVYNEFIYEENLNIKYIKTNINNLNLLDSNKLIIIDNNINNISLILPSTNVTLGLSYNIILLNDLLYLNIYFEDNELHLENYDKIKGSLFISNKDNKYCKTISSSLEIIDTKLEVDLSKNIILKTNTLKNSIVHNTGLFQFGQLKITCCENINNKFVWNIEGNLIGNSVNYKNTYLYNTFI